ncbi:MAG: HslU--HslV peptidase ATPase subunit, partial [Rhodocyclaceae bacterium]|nr:HslU--HslV peptidase ATPase subunit [Rhodocyclaceae bacterium]
RRLYTVMEKLLEEISFAAGAAGVAAALTVDADYVDERLAALAQREDLSRYVL